MKRLLNGLWICTLCVLLVSLPIAAFSETAEGMVLSATVEAKQEVALKAPASGELAPFTLRAGDVVLAGERLFTVEPVNVYADISGTVADVYAAPGDSADAAVSRYGAVMKLEYENRYEIVCNVRTGHNTATNRNPYVGMPVYLRSANEEHFADGVITSVEGGTFTVEVIGGDLVFTQDVKVYREPDYENNTLLARARQSVVAPYNVTASGTVLDVLVKRGDTVRAGDLLFTYVPDVLDPDVRKSESATAVTADEDLVINAVNVQQGASVQKGQALATAYVLGSYELAAQADEGDIGAIHVGDTMTVRFEEANLPTAQAVVTAIGGLGSDAEVSRYTVYLDFEAPEGVLIGMHATVER